MAESRGARDLDRKRARERERDSDTHAHTHTNGTVIDKIITLK